ncbi:lytic transglycosylase domain-containing protein [uncultured Litoreibacter sp.]|uniref:lytic transglycosylase domain-containing protein n=1 Tax=uncultured Litoreibacter sp. TaxID=1392394 RepID=UPI002624320E|nr:lytic transglycosylase domain-containing protein [uncultured Litoreibacter sp.]
MSYRRNILITALALCVAAPVSAGSHKPAFGGDFTFRKIKPPSSGAGRRITVQIKPEDQPKVAAAAPKAASKAKSSDLDWFWDTVSPDIGTPVAGRFTDAVEHVAKAPTGKGVPEPRLDTLQSIASAHGTDILIQTLDKKVSPALVLALIAVESGGRTGAESNKGAQGLMQLIPDTAARFGVTDSTDPVQNIKGGVAYLDWLMKEFNGDPILALAGYNAGEGAVRSHNGVPPYAETRLYVPKVLAAWRVARSICLTPPLLVSDGCVFRTKG